MHQKLLRNVLSSAKLRTRTNPNNTNLSFTMDFACCANDDHDLDAAESGDLHNSLMTESDEEEELVESVESAASFDDQANTLHVDYKMECTPLFKAIEQEDWKGLLFFLTTGRWNSSPLMIGLSNAHMNDRPVDHQARTWVTCREKDGSTQWRQLPIHAAISYQAPLPVVQKLVELHHDGLRSADDTGNLPLHLAFGFGSHDNVVAYLIKENPGALSIRGVQARFPIDCCDLGSNKHRAEIIRACQEHTRTCMMNDWDRHWKKILSDARRKAGVKKDDPSLSKHRTLENVFTELMQVKMELEKTKRLVHNRPTMVITKTVPLPPHQAASKSVGRSPSELSKKFTFNRTGSKFGGKVKKMLSRTSSASVAPSTASEF